MSCDQHSQWGLLQPTWLRNQQCRRYVTADAMGMAKGRGKHEDEDVDGAGIG